MTIFSVSNSEDLMNALASAKGGDTIELAGGDYGQLDLLTFTTFGVKAIYDSPVTIISADPSNPASFSGMDLREVQNLTFDSVVFDSNYTGGLDWVSPFKISQSTGITIRNSLFQGELASGTGDPAIDGFATGKGLSVGYSSGIVIENNEFTTWHRALTIGSSQDLTISGNDIHSSRSDGMNFAQVQNVVIENNYIHDFVTSLATGDHPDMIQFWTYGSDIPSTNIIIRGNTLDMGDGGWTQSIFMRNEVVDSGLAGPEMFYQNVLIENNTIYNAHSHGISVGETNGLTIQNNTVLRAGSLHDNEIASVTIPKITVKPTSTSVVIEGNITSAVNGFSDQADWTAGKNAILQPADYLQAFITSSLDPVAGAHNFIALPDGVIETLQAGATPTQFLDAPDILTPQFQVHSDRASGQALVFDASLTVDAKGIVPESEAIFLWTFGDGSSATGRVVKHAFATPGHHDVALTVMTREGTTAQATYTVGIKGSDVVQFNAQTGHFEALAYGEETALDGSGLTLQASAEGYALKLSSEGAQLGVKASELSELFGTDNFEMFMSLKADSTASSGEVARVHDSFIVSVDQTGNFKLDLFPSVGPVVTMVSNGISLTDGAVHDVTVRFDGQTGLAEILIDGQLAASKAISGSLKGDARPLSFGAPWGGQSFAGELSAFKLSADSRDYPVYDGQTLPVSSTETSTTESPTLTTTEEPGATEDSTTTPEEPIVTEEAPAAPEEDASAEETPTEYQQALPTSELETVVMEPLLTGGYQLDIAAVATSDTVKLHDNAHVAETADGPALTFDGKKDYASLGRLTEFEASQKLAFSVDFATDTGNSGGSERLVWNHMKVGLTLEGDRLVVHAANIGGHFSEGFRIDGLGLDNGNMHTVTVMVDAETDRLQVIVNDEVVLDERNTDFDFVGAGGHEWGWSLGTAWNRWFEGEVYDFQVSDDFSFVEAQMADGNVLI